MDKKTQDRWEAAAWALPASVDKLPVPFHVLAGEALDVTRFCQRNWEPVLDRSGQVTRPGLKSAVGNGTFADNIVKELLELHDVLQAAQTSYQLLVSGPTGAPVERAQFLLGELRSVLEWFFDDGREDVADAQLDRLIETHDGAFSQDAVAAALFDFAELANRHRDAIAGLGGFDAELIDDATKVAMELRERSAGPAADEPLPAESQALELRNRLGSLRAPPPTSHSPPKAKRSSCATASAASSTTACNASAPPPASSSAATRPSYAKRRARMHDGSARRIGRRARRPGRRRRRMGRRAARRGSALGDVGEREGV
jgi:hypothetical protein